MDYSQHNIDQLLERYWAGDTSVEEENLLKQYFRFGKVDEKHKTYSELFQLEEEAECTVSDGFEEKLLGKIETETKVVPINRRRNMWRGLAAACVIALFGTVAVQLNKLDNQDPVETADITPVSNTIESRLAADPEALEAWNETKMALVGLSNRMNKGQKETLHLSKFNQATMAVKGESK